MKQSKSTLSNEIKKNILSRIVLCICILTIAHIITISFYIYLFTTQTKHHLNDLSNDLTPYIISQEIIENRYAINLKLDELSKLNNIQIQWFKEINAKKNTSFKFSSILNWKYTVPVRAIDNKYYGYYIITGSLLNNQWMMLGFSIQFLFLMIFVILICFILYPIAYSIPRKIIINPINMLVKLLHKNDQAELDSFTAPYEILLLRDHFIKILSIQNQILKKAEILKISTQVAHDIRSPLAAINVAISDVSSISENRRILIRNASRRINDIANNLLLQAKKDAETNNNEEADIFPELIFVALDNIVTEKRYEYDKQKINFYLDVSESAYDSFSNINLGSFKRILSNLINNSIEAINFEGEVIICLRSDADLIEISIQDNGCGIPQDKLSSVMEHGFSFNKKNGAGLGLAYAKQYIEQIKGKITLQSTINVGTKVTIKLPKSDFPIWFFKKIEINYNAKIIVLDDDPSIHDAWSERFGHLSEVNIVHFYKASDLINDSISCPLIADLYLIDYELLNDNMNGLDVIEKLRLDKHAILVTSCFEDKALRDRCERLDVKIIPKLFVPYIPISTFVKSQINDLVFIDNDDLMRATWSFAAKKAGLNISTYSSPKEFDNEINRYQKDTLIYIDSDLGDNVKGEQYAKYLYDCGFTNLYLATGYLPNQFDHLPWIKLIVSKDPPFLLKN